MSVSVDSTFAFDPNVQDSGMAARGLYVTMVTWCDHQMYTRPDEFDGTFDLKRVKNVGGTLRLVRELVANGLFEEVSEGVYTVVTRRGLAVFGSFKNQKKPLTPEEAAELHNKKVNAGHAGGKASGLARQAKAEAKAKQNASDETKQTASTNVKQNEADAKQTASTSGKQNASTTIPNQTIPISSPNPSAPKTEAEPNRVPLAQLEDRMLADPFTTAWNAYPSHTGSRKEAETAFHAATQGLDGLPPCQPKDLIGAVISYAKTVDQPRYAPKMSRWLRNGQYVDHLPSKPNRTEWGGITRQWLQQHAISLVPAGAWTDSVEQTFWAHVKTGEEPETVARRLVNEINERSQASRATSPAARPSGSWKAASAIGALCATGTCVRANGPA